MPALILIDRPAIGMPGDGPAFRVLPVGTPVITATDLGITRGDGIFETVAIHDGYVHAAEAHLQRFARSARMLDLPEPDLDAYRDAVQAGIRELGPVKDAFAKYVLTRGEEYSGVPGARGFVHLDVNPAWSRERTTGISVVTLSRGYARDIAETAPWLLQGAKTLSYAVNRSVLREAVRRGADDVLFTTTDGFLLEGPTSSVVLRLDGIFVTTPPESGILPGTAQMDMLDLLAAEGFTTRIRDVTLDELAAADALWMTNSQRLATPVHTLDGKDVTVDRELTDRLNDQLLRRTV
ncbi:aminodeoxychorismate lyase [Kineosporia succinea]|uniref:4-amino-4-deoxychorismate lyase n=1 Tax=Kineosporia succinea TaxID=84632 RepID=A0ABT9PB89_9ACTN|nr:aminodeoxychorismate lyase [Kineosporia succinea]MDP9829757.1 4-amino-4-deoxychorismate lyase [Kineosporia succinea]